MGHFYLVWGYDQYYPTGPGDLRGIFFSQEEANLLEEDLKGKYDYVEVTSHTAGEQR